MADTAIVGAATFVSRLLGFARNAAVSALFGQGWKADVLNAVFTIPMNLRKLVAEGALSTAFIPVLTRSLADDPTGTRARAMVRALFSLQLVVLVPLCLLSILFAPQIIALLAPFGGDAQKQALATDLFRWFIGFLVLVSWSAVMMGVENTHQKFLVPAISPILFSVSVIAFLILLSPSMGVYAQVPGVLIGGLLPIVLQWFPLRKLGYSMRPLVRFWIPELRDTLKKWGPALTVSVISLLNQQISMTLASSLAEGSVTALSNAIVFWQLPAGVLSASVVTVYFPKMSRLAAAQDITGASRALGDGIRLLAMLLIPAGVLTFLFAEPAVALAYQRGLFTYENTVVAAGVLAYLAWGLFFSGAFNLLQRYFYAKGDFRTPFYASIVWAISDVVVSVVLMLTPLGVKGLAMGSVVGFAVGALILLVVARKDLGRSSILSLLWFSLRVLIAMAPAFFAFEVLRGWTGIWWMQGMTLTSFGLLLLEGLALSGLGFAGLLVVGIRPWTLGLRKKEG